MSSLPLRTAIPFTPDRSVPASFAADFAKLVVALLGQEHALDHDLKLRSEAVFQDLAGRGHPIASVGMTTPPPLRVGRRRRGSRP